MAETTRYYFSIVDDAAEKLKEIIDRTSTGIKMAPCGDCELHNMCEPRVAGPENGGYQASGRMIGVEGCDSRVRDVL